MPVTTTATPVPALNILLPFARREVHLRKSVMFFFFFALGCCVSASATAPLFERPRHRVRLSRMQAKRTQASQTRQSAVLASDGGVNTTLPAEQLFGERLFLETRFAQFFASHFDGDVNHPLAEGDPTVARTEVLNGTSYDGPFVGKSINCRSCHLVEEFAFYDGAGSRTYSDFVQRSPVPARGDPHKVTTRNAMNMVDSFLDRPTGMFLHADGEFVTPDSLVKATFTGRNFGWQISEHDQAVAHIAKVIREDDGSDRLGIIYGGSYSKLLLGTAPDIPEYAHLPESYRLDVSKASDGKIFDAVTQLVSAYLVSLEFARNDKHVNTGSPYDLFIARNGLPAAPMKGESGKDFSKRLLAAVEALQDPKWVEATDGMFQYHFLFWKFGPQELQGMKVFLRAGQQTTTAKYKRSGPIFLLASLQCAGVALLASAAKFKHRRHVVGGSLAMCVCLLLVACGSSSQSTTQSSEQVQPATVAHTGNCATCHIPPNFTDFRFHNTGATQEEYESIHGVGSFASLYIPSYAERQQRPDDYLPQTPQHPNASGVFRSVPSGGNPSATDLGMWNIYANPDFPEPQKTMQALLCDSGACDPNDVLLRAIGRFKTPTLRDLEDSGPFLHTGNKKSVEEVVSFYVQMSKLANAGTLRNADPAISGVSIDDQDAAALAAFLRSLTEDYD